MHDSCSKVIICILFLRFVSREEALPILHQSGLDPAAVEQIWSMADEDKDNRLTSKEFSVAFHIIVGVT